MRLCKRLRAMRRDGVTLLEVMFAIGVVVIGLVGVAALLPVAAHQARKGLQADRADALGKSAVQEFRIRGMGRRDNWAFWNVNLPPGNSPQFTAFSPGVGDAFLIDPRFVAEPANQDAAGTGSRFPYALANDQNVRRMRRITLRSVPGGAVMGRLQADQVFVSQDDLVFDRPTDRTLSPVQNYGAGDKREFEGHLSWMAMLAPKLHGNNASRDLYTLSVIIFNRRDSSMDRDEDNERVVNVGAFHSGGLGGGDVRLVTRRNRAEDLELQAGDWVMLSGQQSAGSVFRWYRVLATDSDPEVDQTDPQNPVWRREVTLHGPDWTSTGQTQATLVKDVVAVYEKTIRLESSSLWDQ